MMSSHVSNAPTESPMQRSPWHSPVPYLFGGLAAMLGLIAFALLILACSYWKLSGYLEDENEENSGNRDLEMGESDEKPKLPPVYEEKILVIMAGHATPTFLAKPMSSRASSFGSQSSGGDVVEKSDGDGEVSEKKKVSSGGGGDDQVQVGSTENREASNQVP